jgi:RNA polymerase sigma-70 factor, ECF subfamily
VTYTPELDEAVCRFARKHHRMNGPLSVEDVVQIGRMAAWEALPKHRADGVKVSTFVYPNVRWRIVDAYRRAVPVPVESERLQLVIDGRESSPDVADVVAGDDRVASLLGLLTARQRELVERTVIGGERPVDVARDIGLHKGTVAYARHRALAKLRKAA